MKHQLLFFFLLTVTATCTSQSELSSKFKKLDWLIGSWNRTNITKPEKTAFEIWEKKEEGKLAGFGIVMQGTDTVFVEKFELVIRDNAVYYVADVPENKQPVFFSVTSITDNSFICENPEHDFPKKITYHWDGLTLKAQISGDGKSSDFLFKRK
jgi:hypothetical protein